MKRYLLLLLCARGISTAAGEPTLPNWCDVHLGNESELYPTERRWRDLYRRLPAAVREDIVRAYDDLGFKDTPELVIEVGAESSRVRVDPASPDPVVRDNLLIMPKIFDRHYVRVVHVGPKPR